MDMKSITRVLAIVGKAFIRNRLVVCWQYLDLSNVPFAASATGVSVSVRYLYVSSQNYAYKTNNREY